MPLAQPHNVKCNLIGRTPSLDRARTTLFVVVQEIHKHKKRWDTLSAQELKMAEPIAKLIKVIGPGSVGATSRKSIRGSLQSRLNSCARRGACCCWWRANLADVGLGLDQQDLALPSYAERIPLWPAIWPKIFECRFHVAKI